MVGFSSMLNSNVAHTFTASGKAAGFCAGDHEGFNVPGGDPALELRKLSFGLHKALAAEHNGTTTWDYREARFAHLANRETHSSTTAYDSSLSMIGVDDSILSHLSWDEQQAVQVHPKKFTEAMLRVRSLSRVRNDPRSLLSSFRTPR